MSKRPVIDSVEFFRRLNRQVAIRTGHLVVTYPPGSCPDTCSHFGFADPSLDTTPIEEEAAALRRVYHIQPSSGCAE